MRATRWYPTLLAVFAAQSLLVGCANRDPAAGDPPDRRRGGRDKIINDFDDREELFENGHMDNDPTPMHNGRSVPAIVHESNLSRSGSGWTLQSRGPIDNMCPDERWAQQDRAAWCSAALVGDDLILTALHCVQRGQIDATKFLKVVFGFAVEAGGGGQGRRQLGEHEVYGMVGIVDAGGIAEDWAVVRLDRKVHPHFKRLRLSRDELRYSTDPQRATPLYMIGYGSGLPVKISRIGYAVANQDPAFRFATDGTAGNSGSPIFRADTHEIVGVAYEGPGDFVVDEANQCLRWEVCSAPGGICPMVAIKPTRAWPSVPNPPVSCAGACGTRPPGQSCACDQGCGTRGDCCPDVAAICFPHARACDNACGGDGGGCMCDAQCLAYGDCCPGYLESCGSR